MTYKLTFLDSAKKEWSKLSPDLQNLFKTKLYKIIENPHIEKNRLAGMENCYKIKLRNVGYRLVYKVFEERIIIQLIAVGKRDKNLVYKMALSRV